MTLSQAEILALLREGEVTLKGEFVWGSNYTFLAQVEKADMARLAVYKPNRGERPLWDFPSASLAHRETATYLLSEALGWELVPPTVYRRQAPLGPGSVQLFVDHDPEYLYFNFSVEDRQRLRPAVVFDLLINNADRKGSHILRAVDGHLWLIDHGVCFHVESKLRTVIWDFAGEAIPQDLRSRLIWLGEKLSPAGESPSELVEALIAHISRAEVRALSQRAKELAESGYFPTPDPNRRNFPWPQI